MGIYDYYIRLERKEKSSFIQKVLEITEMSYPSFMRKIKDDSWNKLQRDAIETIIEEEQKNEGGGVL